MAKSLIDKIIYMITDKPKYYKEVKNPPKTILGKLLRPQDARQIQYNNWSKSHQFYSGSYLPYSSKELTKQGWKEIPIPRNQTKYNQEFVKTKTGQQVLRHGRHKDVQGNTIKTHYHWKNPQADTLPKREKHNNRYYDKYGEVCARNSPESHIKPHQSRRTRK